MDDAWYDLSDPLDPLNPVLSSWWSTWDCPQCAADGSPEDLVEGACPECGSRVDLLE